MAVAACFVAAALVATAVEHGSVGQVLFGTSAAPILGVLVLRRTRPVVPVCVISGFVTVGVLVQTALGVQSGGGGVWLFALMFASYSLGAHGPGRLLCLGVLMPLLVILIVDLPTRHGWSLASGVVFVTVFVGVVPTAVGRLVRVRRERLITLEAQRDRIVYEQLRASQAAALAERLRTTERLQPALLDGLRLLAEQAESGAPAGEIEQGARRLLGRTREEVVALTAPVEVPQPARPPLVDHVRLVRGAAQRWTVLAAGGLAVALCLESTKVLPLSAPLWVAIAGSMLIGLPLTVLWWRPLAALALAWCVVVPYSRLVAPLDGSLSGTAFTLAGAFAVAALSRRGGALVGLALCWTGQLIGIGTDDPLGEGCAILVCWLGGLAVNEVSRLVEQSRANNRLLAGQEDVARQRAVVEERLRVARDLHDQIGHSLTVVALQAAAARRMAQGDPRRARQVMTTIAEAARNGLEAMAGTTTPDLVSLLERTRSAGLAVRTEIPHLGSWEPELRAVAYRVVQEALTNVLRHAPGAEATVTMRPAAGVLRVTVRNSAPWGPGTDTGSGRGLSGLRASVTALGGELRWGPCDDGGFEVRAVLPARGLVEAAR